jgi:hypothetical protein
MMMMSIDDLPEADGKEAEIHAHASCSIKKKKEKKIRESSRTQDLYATHSSDPNPAPKGKKNQERKICKATSKIFA